LTFKRKFDIIITEREVRRMKKVYILIDDLFGSNEVLGIYSTLYKAIEAGKEYYEDCLSYENSEIAEEPENETYWTLSEITNTKGYEDWGGVLGHIQAVEVDK
jgi:hypothetical protein